MRKVAPILLLFISILFLVLGVSCQKEESLKTISGKIENIQIPEFAKVYFGFNKYGPKKGSSEVISNISNWLKKNPEFKVLVEGHADTQGNASYNKKLSEQRANYIKKILVKNGIDENRILTNGFGEENPISKKNSENRRVEFKIIKVEKK